MRARRIGASLATVVACMLVASGSAEASASVEATASCSGISFSFSGLGEEPVLIGEGIERKGGGGENTYYVTGPSYENFVPFLGPSPLANKKSNVRVTASVGGVRLLDSKYTLVCPPAPRLEVVLEQRLSSSEPFTEEPVPLRAGESLELGLWVRNIGNVGLSFAPPADERGDRAQTRKKVFHLAPEKWVRLELAHEVSESDAAAGSFDDSVTVEATTTPAYGSLTAVQSSNELSDPVS